SSTSPIPSHPPHSRRWYPNEAPRVVHRSLCPGCNPRALLRGRPDQPSHVVIGKSVRPGGISNLLDLARQIVHVVHSRRVRIALGGQPVERVIHIGDDLALAVVLAGQVAHRIVGVSFYKAGRESRLRHSPKGIVSERSDMPAASVMLSRLFSVS